MLHGDGTNTVAKKGAMGLATRATGSVSNVDIDRNNALQIKALGVIISTFETLPTIPMGTFFGVRLI
jgi:hypothetical protein